MQSDKVLKVPASMLFISKYSMSIQRWAGKLPPHSARPNWRLQVQALPSSITSWMRISWTWWLSSACLCCKNHTKSSHSVLSKSCSALQRNSLLFCGLCVSWYPAPVASRRTMTLHCTAPHYVPTLLGYVCQWQCHWQVLRAAHHAYCSYGHCSHHARGVAVVATS